MSVCNLTANIANSIVGSAVLTLPTGMERLSDNGMATSEALGVGVVLLLVFGTLNAWTFTLIAEACERTGVPQPAYSLTFCAIIHSRQCAGAFQEPSSHPTGTCSYTAAWQKTLGPRTAWLVSSSTLLISFNNAVICQSIIGARAHEAVFPLSTPRQICTHDTPPQASA